mmetsp:Transcript_27748/g.64562  ORF Transcript_27748/g.64562 Transcript_27748/m.64562 type:complete len:165 (+) Transcript_27748:50-544(+)
MAASIAAGAGGGGASPGPSPLQIEKTFLGGGSGKGPRNDAGPKAKRPANFLEEEGGEDGEESEYGAHPINQMIKGASDVESLYEEEHFSKCDPCRWTHNQVIAWLMSTPWSHYKEVFHQHGITCLVGFGVWGLVAMKHKHAFSLLIRPLPPPNPRWRRPPPRAA